MQGYAAVNQLFGDLRRAGFMRDFQVFCAATGTKFVVAGPGTSGPLMATLKALAWPSRQVDDVTIFTVMSAPNG
jgi:hypothetical protein